MEVNTTKKDQTCFHNLTCSIFEKAVYTCLHYGLSFDDAIRIVNKCHKDKLFNPEFEPLLTQTFIEHMKCPGSGRLGVKKTKTDFLI